ncbi:WD repeat-containing protein [Ceratobasidium sp. AG-Ba]|nr:WD repeat-containing protein [Ceratobasidium sp. AG-Ba]
MSVLDSPDHLKLHTSVDFHSFGVPRSVGISSRICWMDRDAVIAALNKNFERPLEGSLDQQDEEKARRDRLRTIVNEGWDLFAIVSGDGTVVVRAVTNIDRRPPTLLHQFATLHSPPHTLPSSTKHLSFHYEPSSSIASFSPAQNCIPIRSPQSAFLMLRPAGYGKPLSDKLAGELEAYDYFVRTASGMAFALCYEDGGGEVWKRHPHQGIGVKLQLNSLGPTPFPTSTPDDAPVLILPVDPMGWTFTPKDSSEPHDSLLVYPGRSLGFLDDIDRWTMARYWSGPYSANRGYTRTLQHGKEISLG